MSKQVWLWAGLLGLVVATGCEKAEKGGGPESALGIRPPAGAPTQATPAAPAAQAPRGPNERFYKIQDKLDPGGSFYLYSDLKDALRNLVKSFEPVATGPQAPPQAAQVYQIANRVIDRLGLYGIHDLGISVLPDGDLNRTKMFVSFPEGRRGLPELIGGAPHPIQALDFATSDTVLFLTVDLEVAKALALARQVAGDIDPSAQQQLNAALAQPAGPNGPTLESVIGSLGNEFTVLVALDPSERITLPLPGDPYQLDSPRLAVIAKVTGPVIFDLLKQHVPGAVETTQGALRIIRLPAPPNPFWPVAPVVATDGAYLYLTSHEGFLTRFAARGGALAKGEEFKRLAGGLPTEGNGLLFVSERLAKTVIDLTGKVFEQAPDPQAQAMAPMLTGLATVAGPMYGIRINQPDGILAVTRSKAGVMRLLPMQVTAVPMVAMLSAIAVPNFLEAQTRAKVSRAKADMRSIATALEAYSIDYNAYAGWSNEPQRNAFGPMASADPTLAGQPTFVAPSPLTTPISYLTTVFADPFAPTKGATFSYWATPPAPDTPQGWIIWSPGPDNDYDLTLDNIGEAYNPAQPVPSPYLVDRTYDPTNGTVSDGDVWRAKQD